MEENNILAIIGNNIKNARNLKKMTQECLADKMNVSDKFISMIERGQSGLSLNSIVDICQILDIEPNTLFNGLYNYSNENDKYIINTLSSLSDDDKIFLVNTINYIIKRGGK